MPESKLKYQSYTHRLSTEQQETLSQSARHLYEFLLNRLKQRDATEISVTDREAARYARCEPEQLAPVQSEIHRAGLFNVESDIRPKMQPYEFRTRYILPESEPASY